MGKYILVYLKMLNLRVGLVLNFGLPTLKAGIQHVINETKEEYLSRLRKEQPVIYRAVIEEESQTLSQIGEECIEMRASISPK